ncbi:hypothetical protein PT300_15435 [Enterobacteriaceae bacterium ESL0689]|nr:hypothetical protein [Enterobacteriaceae bacterium ESL0689]
MTPRQRRARQAGLEQAAAAPRKRWLGKFKPITAVQSAWVKSLLNIWGECYGGESSEERALVYRGFWGCIQDSEWSDDEARRITETIKKLHKIGYRGAELLTVANGILWPQKIVSDSLAKQTRHDDADFVERCILSALDKNDPVYLVGIDFYGRRKRVSEIARFLQGIAPWLTRKQAEDRVRWCISHFNCAVFLEMKAAMKPVI